MTFHPPFSLQNGDVIDHTWTRMKTYRKVLRIRNVVESDTGVLTCRGINGFGSASVRVELLVSGAEIINFCVIF